jgi:hypothetical protein
MLKPSGYTGEKPGKPGYPLKSPFREQHPKTGVILSPQAKVLGT